MTCLHLRVAAAMLGAVAACDAFGPARRTFVVLHHAVECVGVDLSLCLLVKERPASEFTRHYGPIEGFAYRWGFVYEIEVEEHAVPNPPADASSIRTVLRAIVSEERVSPGTEFDLILTARGGRVVEVGGDRYRFYSAAEFICPPGVGCGELQTRIAAGARIKYRLAHPPAPGDPFTVVQWEICDPSLAGSGTCSS